MENGPATRILERAFELARSGEVGTVLDLGRRLKAEGFEAVASHMASPSLRNQLGSTMRQRPALMRVSS
jgi:hypothetical protein